MFDDDISSKNNNNDDLLGEFDDNTSTVNSKQKENNYNMSDNELNELLFDDMDDESNESNTNDDVSTNEILDIQKELEAKFDELFGDSDDDE